MKSIRFADRLGFAARLFLLAFAGSLAVFHKSMELYFAPSPGELVAARYAWLDPMVWGGGGNYFAPACVMLTVATMVLTVANLITGRARVPAAVMCALAAVTAICSTVVFSATWENIAISAALTVAAAISIVSAPKRR